MSGEAAQQNLIAFFHKKIVLYRSLLDCLKRERDNLVQMNLDGLWNISKKKDELCAKIAAVRQQIGAEVNTENEGGNPTLSDIMGAMPEEKKEDFLRLYHTVRMLKSDVDAYRKENVHFVDDSLQFIDELIMIITGVTHMRNVYDHRCRLKKTGNNVLLRREV
jgi:hypothetical protein